MTHHVYLLLTPEKADSAALMMKHLGQRYGQYIHRKYARSGTLWEGRFCSCLAQSEPYLLSCYRYLERNPVRAGRVRHPHDYRWSSYHPNGDGKTDKLIQPHDEYRRLGRDPDERRSAYRALCKAQLDPQTIEEIRLATNGNFALGAGRFQKQIATVLKRRVVRGKAGRPSEQHDGFDPAKLL